MKKYDKIMSVFTETLTKLDNLVQSNTKEEGVLITKRIDILAKAEAKADTIQVKAVALMDETNAALKAANKIKEFLA